MTTLALAAVLLSPRLVTAAVPSPVDGGGGVPGEYLVLVEGLDDAELDPGPRCRVARRLYGGPAVALVACDGDGASAMRSLGQAPGVVWVQPNFLYKPTATPTDAHLAQWHLDHPLNGFYDMRAEEAWDYATGSDAVVAVIDTGVRLSHDDLDDALWSSPSETCGDGVDDDGNGLVDDCVGWDFADGDADASATLPASRDHDGDGVNDCAPGHGTHVAGVAVAEANNGVTGTGVAWRGHVLPLKVARDATCILDSAAAVEAVRYAADVGAHVINASFGGPAPDKLLEDALRDALDAGVLVVIAAGNDGVDLDLTPTYPASADLPGAIVVGGVAQLGDPWSSSNFGGPVAITAGSETIWGPSHLGDSLYTDADGTSVAAPQVAGAAVVLWGVNPHASAARVRQALVAGADAEGRLDLRAAVEQVLAPDWAEVEVSADTIRLSWSWDGPEGEPVGFIAGTSWEVEVVTEDPCPYLAESLGLCKGYALPADACDDDPWDGSLHATSSDDTDHPFPSGAYRDIYNHCVPKVNALSRQILADCGAPNRTIAAAAAAVVAAEIALQATDEDDSFAVGTLNPEEFVRGVVYSMQYAVDTSHGLGVEYAWIQHTTASEEGLGWSSLEQCPELAGSRGGGEKALWLRNLCVPSGAVAFAPVEDVGEVAFCCDEDDDLHYDLACDTDGDGVEESVGGLWGTAYDCDDGDVSSTDACVCLTDADCDDGDACNGAETCAWQDAIAGGLCAPGTPVSCGVGEVCSSDHACVTDADGDEYGVEDGDCDDTDPDFHPFAAETCGDGIDHNCDGSDACTYVVPTDMDLASAVAQVNADDGGTILVEAGTYAVSGYLGVLAPDVSILGAGSDKVFIEGDGGGYGVLNIDTPAERFVLEGVTVVNSPAGYDAGVLLGAVDGTLRDVRVEGTYLTYSFYLIDADGFLLDEVEAWSGHWGVTVLGSNGTLSRAWVEGHDDVGVYIDADSEPTVENSVIVDNVHGVYTLGSPRLIHNTIAENSVVGTYVDDGLPYSHNELYWDNGESIVCGWFEFAEIDHTWEYPGGTSYCAFYGELVPRSTTTTSLDAGYRLPSGSDLVDAADASAGLSLDREGDPRPTDGEGDGVAEPDPGADELLP